MHPEWRRHQSRLRYERRLANAPDFLLKLYALLIAASLSLIGATIAISVWLGR